MEIHCSPEVSSEYLDEVWEILRDKEFLSLCQYCHHQRSNRLLHSLNVSYISWKIAKRFGCDERAAARAGLLHDFTGENLVLINKDRTDMDFICRNRCKNRII